MSETLKNERIEETKTAADKVASGETEPVSKAPEAATKTVEKPKSSMIRMIGYPVAIGAILGYSGRAIANKMGKNKMIFTVGGVVVGATIGYLLYRNWAKKNLK